MELTADIFFCKKLEFFTILMFHIKKKRIFNANFFKLRNIYY